MTRSWNSCSLCCKLPYVVELNKPIDTWCQHARPGCGGCAIYPDRPFSCRGFICGWLSGELEVGDEWFPARCKMIIAPRVPPHTLADQGMLVTVDPAYPNAWRREPYYTQLRTWAQDIIVEMRIGCRCIRLNADGTEHEVMRTRAWLEGHEECSSTPTGQKL
jgi:hypothetical protein